jgi:hypothetical protein
MGGDPVRGRGRRQPALIAIDEARDSSFGLHFAFGKRALGDGSG